MGEGLGAGRWLQRPFVAWRPAPSSPPAARAAPPAVGGVRLPLGRGPRSPAAARGEGGGGPRDRTGGQGASRARQGGGPAPRSSAPGGPAQRRRWEALGLERASQRSRPRTAGSGSRGETAAGTLCRHRQKGNPGRGRGGMRAGGAQMLPVIHLVCTSPPPKPGGEMLARRASKSNGAGGGGRLKPE